jgi:hypothetical protein
VPTREGADPRARKAQLLARSSPTTSALRLEVARLLVLAGEACRTVTRGANLFRVENRARRCREHGRTRRLGWMRRARFESVPFPPRTWPAPLARTPSRRRSSALELALRRAHWPLAHPGGNRPAELANLSSFFSRLHALARLLEKEGGGVPPLAARDGARRNRGAVSPTPRRTRHALKLAAGQWRRCWLIALTTQRPDHDGGHMWTRLQSRASRATEGDVAKDGRLRQSSAWTVGVRARAGDDRRGDAHISTTVLSYMNTPAFIVLMGCAWAAH